MNEIKENFYKPDFEIMDRYINFSAELLRLSLLAIGGFGTLLLLQLKKETGLPLTIEEKYLLFGAILFLGICSGLCLAHRFFASDSMAYHIAFLRKNEEEEKVGRNKRLKLSGKILILAEVTFGIGVLFFALGIITLLFSKPA